MGVGLAPVAMPVLGIARDVGSMPYRLSFARALTVAAMLHVLTFSKQEASCFATVLVNGCLFGRSFETSVEALAACERLGLLDCFAIAGLTFCLAHYTTKQTFTVFSGFAAEALLIEGFSCIAYEPSPNQTMCDSGDCSLSDKPSQNAPRLMVLLGLSMLAAGHLPAQVNSNTAAVTLNATLGETLSVSATPSAVSFALVPGGAVQGSTPVSVTTTWVASATRSSVNLFAWFSSPSVALSDGAVPANNISSSAVFGQVVTGTPTTFTPFTQTTALGSALAGLPLFTQSLTSSNRSGSRVDNLVLRIDLTSLPQLPAGAYTGVLNLQAQAL